MDKEEKSFDAASPAKTRCEPGAGASCADSWQLRFLAGAKRACRRFLYVALCVLLWLLLNRFELLDKNLLQSAVLILSVVLYVLALPLSALIRLDSFVASWALEGRQDVAISIALLAVLLNFLLLGGVLGLRKKVSAVPVKANKGPIIVRRSGEAKTVAPRSAGGRNES